MCTKFHTRPSHTVEIRSPNKLCDADQLTNHSTTRLMTVYTLIKTSFAGYIDNRQLHTYETHLLQGSVRGRKNTTKLMSLFFISYIPKGQKNCLQTIHEIFGIRAFFRKKTTTKNNWYQAVYITSSFLIDSVFFFFRLWIVLFYQLYHSDLSERTLNRQCHYNHHLAIQLQTTKASKLKMSDRNNGNQPTCNDELSEKLLTWT